MPRAWVGLGSVDTFHPPLEEEGLFSQQKVCAPCTHLCALPSLDGASLTRLEFQRLKPLKVASYDLKVCGTEDILSLNHSHTAEMPNKMIIEMFSQLYWI